MKIIKEGIPLNRIKCTKCKCIFEYDKEDIIKETKHELTPSFSLAMDYYDEVIEVQYVNCPCCKEKYIIDKNTICSTHKRFEKKFECDPFDNYPKLG